MVGVSSCDIPIKVLESVDHGEYRVFFQSFDTLFIVVFGLSLSGGGGYFQSKVIGVLLVFLGYKILILVFLGFSGKCLENGSHFS